MKNSTSKAKPCKPEKPYPDFPLFPHETKRWAKKINGKFFYFGPWNDWETALKKYQYERDYLYRNESPPSQRTSGLSMVDLVNRYLTHQSERVKTGELTHRSWLDLKRIGKILLNALGRETFVESLRPLDFERLRAKLGEGKKLKTLDNEVTRCRGFFNFAKKAMLIETEVKFGLSFNKPSRKALRKETQSQPQKLFTLDELKAIYQKANPQMKCFMLLAINGGLGNNDIGLLQKRHLVGNWIVYPRPKTTVDRRFPLWPETLEAVKQCLRQSPLDSDFVFVTKYGGLWAKEIPDSPITKEFSKILEELDLDAEAKAKKQRKRPPTKKFKQKGRGFYALRHQFRTIADGCRDQVAINHIMGHVDNSMAANYREYIEDERLQAVVDHVRAWAIPLFDIDQESESDGAFTG